MALCSEPGEEMEEDCAAVFAAGLEPKPRKVKRTLNVFRMLSRLAQHRLVDNARVYIQPALLAKTVVIQSRWRDLYADLVDYPNLIQDLERHFRTGAAPTRAHVRVAQAGAETGGEGILPQKETPITSPTQEGAPTLLQKYSGRRDLRHMLERQPWFEGLALEDLRAYLYLTHTVSEKAMAAEMIDIDARRWEDLLSNDSTKIRSAVAAIRGDKQEHAYIQHLLSVLAPSQKYSTTQRVSAGNAVAYLGDPGT